MRTPPLLGRQASQYESAGVLWSGLPALLDTARVRLTEFWRRMREQFGEGYADSFARDYVIRELEGRTVEEALSQGVAAKDVWRAVCASLDLPSNVR
jgi:hypothetical protein